MTTSDFNKGWEDGVHDRDRDLGFPGNLDDFPFQFQRGYKQARRSTLVKPPVRIQKKRDRDEVDYEDLYGA